MNYQQLGYGYTNLSKIPSSKFNYPSYGNYIRVTFSPHTTITLKHILQPNICPFFPQTHQTVTLRRALLIFVKM